MSEEKKVVVVGGGLAGLSAAYTLKKAGVIADVYEAGSHVGGRCRNDYDEGYEFFVGAGSTEPQWATTFQYLNELGIMDLVQQQAGESGIGTYTKGKPRIMRFGGKGTVPSVLKFFFSALPMRTYVQGVQFLKDVGGYKEKLDFENADFSALHEVNGMTIHEYCVKKGWEDLENHLLHPLVAMMCCGTSDNICMGHLVMLLSLMQGMCNLKGGMGVIGEKLYEQVEGQVRFRTPVREVVIEDGKAIGIRTDEGFVAADHVIIGLDAVKTLEIAPNLPESIKSALRTCGYSKTLYYEFGLEEPIDVIRNSFMFLPKDHEGILNCVSDAASGEEMKPILLAHTRERYHEELCAMEPEARDARVIAAIRELIPEFPENPKITKCYRWDRAVNLEGPGQFEAIEELKKHHMHDVEGLHLSGDYLYLIACTEGSMNSAQTAAEYVLKQMGK